MRAISAALLLPQLLLSAWLCTPAAAAAGNGTELPEPLESLWSLSEAEFNSTLAAAVLNISAELQHLRNFTNFVSGYERLNLTEPLRRLQLVAKLTGTIASQLNASAPAARAATLLAHLQQAVDSLRHDWASGVGEKSLPTCYAQFLALTLAAEAEAQTSLQRLWLGAAAGATAEQLQEFLRMTTTYHSDIGGRVSGSMASGTAPQAARSHCSDGSLRRLFDLFVASCCLVVRGEAVQVAARQLGRSPSSASLAEQQQRWRSLVQRAAGGFQPQLDALWRYDFRGALVGDVDDLVAIRNVTSALADAVQAKLRQKYFYARYAWAQLQPLPLSAAGLLLLPGSSEFVCLSRSAANGTLVLLCRNGWLSQQEEAAAGDEWLRLRSGASSSLQSSIPATLLQAVRSFYLASTDSASSILDQLVTPKLMNARLTAAGNTSFLAVKMATVGATQPVVLRVSDASFGVDHKTGSAWYLVSPVRLSTEHVPATTASPRAAGRLAASAAASLLLPLLPLLLLLL